MNNKEWNKEFREDWKLFLQTKGKFNEEKIKNELHDLVFISKQIGEIYCYLTGGLLSKPMYPARVIISEFENLYLDKQITQDDVRCFIKRSKTKKELIQWLNDYFQL